MITDSELESMTPRELEQLQSRVTRKMIEKIYSKNIVKPTNELRKECY